MAQPKKQSSPRKNWSSSQPLGIKLARRVNATSPVKVKTISVKLVKQQNNNYEQDA